MLYKENECMNQYNRLENEWKIKSRNKDMHNAQNIFDIYGKNTEDMNVDTDADVNAE